MDNRRTFRVVLEIPLSSNNKNETYTSHPGIQTDNDDNHSEFVQESLNKSAEPQDDIGIEKILEEPADSGEIRNNSKDIPISIIGDTQNSNNDGVLSTGIHNKRTLSEKVIESDEEFQPQEDQQVKRILNRDKIDAVMNTNECDEIETVQKNENINRCRILNKHFSVEDIDIELNELRRLDDQHNNQTPSNNQDVTELNQANAQSRDLDVETGTLLFKRPYEPTTKMNTLTAMRFFTSTGSTFSVNKRKKCNPSTWQDKRILITIALVTIFTFVLIGILLIISMNQDDKDVRKENLLISQMLPVMDAAGNETTPTSPSWKQTSAMSTMMLAAEKKYNSTDSIGNKQTNVSSSSRDIKTEVFHIDKTARHSSTVSGNVSNGIAKEASGGTARIGDFINLILVPIIWVYSLVTRSATTSNRLVYSLQPKHLIKVEEVKSNIDGSGDQEQDEITDKSEESANV